MKQKIIGVIAVGAAIVIGTFLLAFGALTGNNGLFGTAILVVALGAAIGAILLSRKN